MPLLALRRRTLAALPPPLPIATSAPHPANVSSSDINIDIDLRRLLPRQPQTRSLTGYDSSLSLASYPESPGSDFSPSRCPLRSSRRSTHRTPPRTRHAPPADTFFARGHVTTLQRAPRFSFSRVASAEVPLATAAAAPLAGPAPSLALSPGSCRSFSGGARTASSIQHPVSSTYIALGHGSDTHLGRLTPPSTRRTRRGARSKSVGKALKAEAGGGQEGRRRGRATAYLRPAKGVRRAAPWP
ncbi:hypothetical protein B0H14DRAFT_305027 [Mycena olivaceomarginata]|nr:hypothetical protein B0H14DRAFT_305027 [Mycena olivaceomarginata]